MRLSIYYRNMYFRILIYNYKKSFKFSKIELIYIVIMYIKFILNYIYQKINILNIFYV